MNYIKCRLGDVAEIIISSIDKKSKPHEKTVRLCNFTDVYHNWAITKDKYDTFMIATANDNAIEKLTLKKGYVAFTKDSETRDDIGIPTYIVDDFDDVVLGYHCALVKPDEHKLSGEYLNAFMNSDYIKKYFELNATGSGMRFTLAIQTLEDMPLLLPELSEQKRIAKVLTDIDSKITVNKKINKELEAMAKELYDYWFVQFDFPGANGKPYKSSGGKMSFNPLLKRNIPEGWEIKSINDFCTSYRGVSYDKSDLLDGPEGGVLVLRGNNIDGNTLVYDDNVAYVPPSFVEPEQKIKKHDIIMTMSSGSKKHVGKCTMFQTDSEHTYGAFMTKFTPNPECPFFAYRSMLSDFFKAKIKYICGGTGINNLTNQTFDETLFPFPPKDVLKEFEKLLTPIYEKVGKNNDEILRLTALRDELLPMLMNGQVTIN